MLPALRPTAPPLPTAPPRPAAVLLLFPVQVGVFSATLPPEALEITRKFMSKPVRILVKRDELTLEGIKQFYVNVVSGEWGEGQGGVGQAGGSGGAA